ncbi:MAG: sulfatase family protein [Streptomycetales bacterium]
MRYAYFPPPLPLRHRRTGFRVLLCALAVPVLLTPVAATMSGRVAAAPNDPPGAAAAAAASGPRPNILLIETDDQTVESLRVMDNVRRLLVRRGTTFTNSYVSWPLCCPSRATVLTGQHAHNHGVIGNSAPRGGYYKLDSTNTLPVWLRRAGYRTAHLCKYLNQYGTRNPREVPRGWSEWRGSVDPTTYNYLDFTLNENGRLRRYRGRYQTDVYAKKAAAMVRRGASGKRPFFTWVAFTAPHTGRPHEPGDPRMSTPAVADRHRNAFARRPVPRDRAFNEANVSDKPRHIRRLPHIGEGTRAAIQESYRQRLEALLAVDEAVARILRALRETGEARNTIVAFTSDNGFFHGEHRVSRGKNLLYEPSARVPLILRGPGIPDGVTRTQPISNIDLAPTFVQAARARPGRVPDGRSLLPLAQNPHAGQGRPVLLEGFSVNRYRLSRYAAVRTPRYFYAEYHYQNGKPRGAELYDMRRDPHQLRSRHADQAYAAIRARLAGQLRGLRECEGAACR